MKNPLMQSDRDQVNTLFKESVNSIAGAVRTFKLVVGSDEESKDYLSTNEDNPYSAKLPVGAFCLRIAHSLWRDIYFDNPNNDEEDIAKRNDLTDLDLDVTPEEAILSIASDLSIEQRNKVISALNKMNKVDCT